MGTPRAAGVGCRAPARAGGRVQGCVGAGCAAGRPACGCRREGEYGRATRGAGGGVRLSRGGWWQCGADPAGREFVCALTPTEKL